MDFNTYQSSIGIGKLQPANCFCKHKFYQNTTMTIPVCIVCACFLVPPQQVEYLTQRLYGPQSLMYLLSHLCQSLPTSSLALNVNLKSELIHVSVQNSAWHLYLYGKYWSLISSISQALYKCQQKGGVLVLQLGVNLYQYILRSIWAFIFSICTLVKEAKAVTISRFSFTCFLVATDSPLRNVTCQKRWPSIP